MEPAMTAFRSTPLLFAVGVAAAIAPGLACAQPAGPADPGRFDGAWIVRIDCPSNTEESGAKGYRYDFPATVTRGRLSGSHGDDDAPGSLRIEGPIEADGSAELLARGRTGNPNYAVNRPSSGTAYSYRIKARFEGARGTGARVEPRVCNFVFVNQ
jgi:hypothetical protein